MNHDNTFMERYAFVVEWYDKNACVMRYYDLLFYTQDNTMMMVITLIFINLRSKI